jgi:DNA-binding GntR family transcriptional regulator
VPANDGSAPSPASVRDAVLRSIAHGSLRPGDALSVDSLVARTTAAPDTVVEALRVLVELGVARGDGRRVVVADPMATTMADTDEVRHILEEVAVRRFVRHATESQIAALRRAVEDVERVAAEPDPPRGICCAPCGPIRDARPAAPRWEPVHRSGCQPATRGLGPVFRRSRAARRRAG